MPKTPARLNPVALRAIREAAHLTRPALCRLIGVQLNAVVTWEDGASSPPAPTLLRLAAALGVPIDDLLADDLHVSPLASARLHAGLTQTQLGELLGVSHSYVSAVERGRKDLPAAWLPVLSELAAHGVDIGT